MAKSIDERVVSMAFENGKFESGVAKTMGTLNKLGDSLKFTGATRGLADIDSASGRISFSSLTQGLQQATAGFSVLSGAAAVALGNLVTQAVQAGLGVAKALTIDPIKLGLQEYETNLNSIQTILANTQGDGTTLKDVNGALDELNKYADQTIYSFSQMAKAIGTFTAAGVGLKDSTEAIKGLSNLLALSGSNTEQAARGMQQYSQAIAANRLTLEDYNSIRSAGFGGKVFQKALFETAQAAGKLTQVPVGQTFEQWEKAGGSFRNLITDSNRKLTKDSSALADAQKEGAKAVKEAQESAAEAIVNAGERVKDAQENVAETTKSSAESIKTAQESVTDAQKSSAEATEDAAQRVKDAQKGVKEATKQGAEDIKTAIQSQKDAVRSSAESIESALDAVREARKRLEDAMKPIDMNDLEAAADSLKTAQLDQADLAGAVTDAQKEQKRTAEDLATAQEKLTATIAGSTPEEQASAQRSLEDAQRAVTDATDAQERALLRQRAAARGVTEAQQQLAETQNAGAKRDENIKTAQDDLTKATENLADTRIKAAKAVNDAEKAVADARVESVRRQKAAGKQLADAEEAQAETIKKARESVRDAEAGLAETRIKSAKSQQDAGQALADAEKEQAKAIVDSRERVADAEESAADRVKKARESLKPPKAPESPFNAKVLTDTLRIFTGDMTAAQLAAKGFSAEQIKAIQAQAKTAVDAATKVKTLTQLFGVAKESAQSGFAETFKILFGDFNEAKKTFTEASTALTGIIQSSATARNALLGDFKELGGRTAVIEGIKNVFQALARVIGPIRDAFRQVFPPTTAKQLADAAAGFRDFTESLKIGPETADNLKRTFAGLFAVLSIGKSILGGVFTAAKEVFKALGDGSGGILNFTGGVGDLVVKLDQAIKKSEGFKNFFVGLGKVLVVPVRLLQAVVGFIGGLFNGFDENKVTRVAGSLEGLSVSLSPLQKVLKFLNSGWDKFTQLLDQVMQQVSPAFDEVIGKFANFGTAVKEAFASADYDQVFKIIQTTLIAGIFLTIKKALGGGLNFDFAGLGTGIGDKIKDTLGSVTGSLKNMQGVLKSTVLLQIATALVLLAAAIKVLATIDGKKLATAMTAIAIGLGQLIGGLALLSAVGGKGAFVTLPIMASGLVILAGAILVLSASIALLSKLSWEELARGLAGVGGALAAVALGVSLIPPSITLVAPALIPLAIALNLLAVAVKIFATMKWEELAKGLVGLGGALTALGVGLALVPKVALLTIGPGLIAVAIGVNILALAVKQFASLNPEQIITGIAGMGLALLVLGAAVSAFPPTIIAQAAGLVVLAIALNGIAVAVALMGGMKVTTIAKGLVGIAGALIILAGGLTLMSGTLLGSAALLAAATALAILAPVLGIMGTMKWGTIVKGLVAIGGTLAVIGVAGIIAGPGLAAVGLGLLALGIGLVAAGAGIYLIAKGVSLLAADGQKGVATFLLALTGLVALLPTIVIDFLKGIVEIAAAMASVAPKVVEAFAKIISSLLDLLVEVAPKLAEATIGLIDAMLRVIVEKAVPIGEAGLNLLVAFLGGVSSGITQIAPLVGEIVLKFLTAVVTALPKLIEAGAKLLVKFLDGVARELPRVLTSVSNVIVKFLEGLTANMPKIVAAGANLVVQFLAGIAKNLPQIISAGGNIIVKIIEGIGKQGEKIVRAATTAMGDFLEACADAMVKLTNKIANIIVKFLNGIETAIRTQGPRIREAGFGVADAMIDGMTAGLKELGYKVFGAVEGIANKLPKLVKKILGIESPSKVFHQLGAFTMRGLANGLDAGGGQALRSVDNTASAVITSLRDGLRAVPDILDGLVDVDPVITPILDLTNLEAGAKQIADLTNVVPITAAASYVQASAISSDQEAGATASPDNTTPVVQEVKFEQNNYSPEALSAAEVYRQTHNQLSLAKKALGVSS